MVAGMRHRLPTVGPGLEIIRVDLDRLGKVGEREIDPLRAQVHDTAAIEAARVALVGLDRLAAGGHRIVEPAGREEQGPALDVGRRKLRVQSDGAVLVGQRAAEVTAAGIHDAAGPEARRIVWSDLDQAVERYHRAVEIALDQALVALLKDD